jgi:hypothetical protein
MNTDFNPIPHRSRKSSGRWVVLAMFGFGTVATAGIWIYWKLHLAPFMPLQKVLAAEFDDKTHRSSPRVDGGWTKNEFKKGPPTLRIVLRVPYDPDERDPRVAATIDRVTALTRQHVDLSGYDTLEIYLVRYAPEQAPRQYEFKTNIADLK